MELSFTICLSVILAYVVFAKEQLVVQEVNQKRIEKTKRDTIAMCKMFNDKLESANQKPNSVHPVREKRQVSSDAAARVENIVDQLYEDLSQEPYRRSMDALQLQSGRRFNFGPAKMDIFGADGNNTTPSPDDTDDDNNGWHKKWKYGIVPYFIDPRTYDSHLSDLLTQAFGHIEKRTCIRLQRLREKPSDPESVNNVEWLYISNPTGIRQCVHSNEKSTNKGVQNLIFGYECMSEGDIVHNVMHVLGFSHEHTRPDRDKHISILWDNIKPGYKKYFEVRKDDPLMNIPYDYASVLHYPARAFSRNGQRTIVTEQDGHKIGQRDGLSETDIEKIGIIYNGECSKRNREYLLATCPSVAKFAGATTPQVTQDDIVKYYKNRLWSYGIVNYKLDSNFTQNEKDNIQTVMEHIETHTHIEFLLVVHDTPINITRSGNIADRNIDSSTESDVNSIPNYNVGSKDLEEKPYLRHASNVVRLVRSYTPGCECPEPGAPVEEREVIIQDDCFNSVNDLLHLFVHILGLDHQHNQFDRDAYIHIFWDHLTEDLKTDLEKKLPPGASVGFPYDYQSVMHYPWLRIKNGYHHIMYPIWNYGWSMGNWQGLSSVDKDKINQIYKKEFEDRKELVAKTKYNQVLRYNPK